MILQNKRIELNNSFPIQNIKDLANDKELRYIQISDYISKELLLLLNEHVFSIRDDICFRVYGFYIIKVCDLDFLKYMTNLTDLSIELSFSQSEIENIEVLTDLKNLSKLHLCIYKLKDYSFIQRINTDLRKLSIYAYKGNFDCEWLIRFRKLESLYLGKAKKNISKISQIHSLRDLTFQGITCSSLDFLMDLPLDKLAISFGAMSCLDTLKNHPTISDIELWRISKLKDIEFLTSLPNLRKFHLWQLPHIVELPKFKPSNKVECIDIDECKNFSNIHSVENMHNLKRLRLIAAVSENEMKYALNNPSIKNISYYCGGLKQIERVNEKIEASGKHSGEIWIYELF